MNFNEFWDNLQDELKHEKEFVTLKQNKKFKACLGYVNLELVVLVTPESSMIQRGRIPKNEFEGIWDNAKGYSNETRFVNKGGRLDLYPRKKDGLGRSNNISYITRLIHEIVQEQKME